MASVVGFQNYQIFPLNKKEAYSFRSGGNQLIFVIDESDTRMLDPTTLRLNYTMRTVTANTPLNQLPPAGGLAEVGRVNPDRQISAAGVGVIEGVIGANNGGAGGNPFVCATSNVRCNSRIGTQSVISDVTIRSNNNNAIIEQSRYYNRLAASILPYTLSQSDYNSFAGITFGAFSASDYAQSLTGASDVVVSTNLLSGLTSQRDLWNLKVLGGARIVLTLNSDQAVLHGEDASADGGCYYELRDVSLTGTYKVLNQAVPPNPAPIAYNNYQCFTSILTSSDDTTNLNLSLGQVLAVWNNSIPSELNNNYLYDASATYPIMQSTTGIGNLGIALNDLCEIKDSVITRASVKFPNDYQVDERVQVAQREIPAAAGTSSYEPLDALRFWNFANGVKSWDRLNHSIVSVNTETVGSSNGSAEPPWGAAGVAPVLTYSQMTGNVPKTIGPNAKRAIMLGANKCYGWGSRVDIADSGMGVDYANAAYSQRILSTNQTGTDPNIVYSFALCKNTLISTPGGPIVRI